jgi:hypothetical protein
MLGLYLIAAHMVGDFVLQTRWQAVGKFGSGLHARALRTRQLLHVRVEPWCLREGGARPSLADGARCAGDARRDGSLVTTESTIEEIDRLVEDAVAFSRATGLFPSVRLNVDLDVFETLRERFGADEEPFEKCGCGSCGNLVTAFEVLLGVERGPDGDPTAGVTVGFVRSATEEETIRALEEIVGE